MNKGQRTLLAVAALFFAPVLAAIFLNSQWSDWSPSSARNYGKLLEPAVQLPADLRPEDAAAGQWALIHFYREDCGGCTELKESLGRVRESLGRHQERLYAGAQQVANWPDSLPTLDEAHWLYVVDPNGFLVLHYEQGADLSGIRKDLDRLLKYSKVGEDA